MLKLRIVSAALLSVPLLVGCGSAATSQPGGSGTSVGRADGVSGQFIAVGGPEGAPNNPQQGVVTLTNTTTHAVFKATTGPDGFFALTVPPGTYTATGLTLRYRFNGHEAVCQANTPFRVYTGDPVAVTVVCGRL